MISRTVDKNEYKASEAKEVSSVRISVALSIYIEQYMFMRNLSKHTIHSNRTAIGSFIDLVGDKQIDRIKLHHIIKWKQMLEHSGTESATIYKYISVMKRLLSYTGKHHTLSVDVDDIQAPRARKKLPAYLDIEDARKIVTTATDSTDRLLIYLLFSTGLRISEAVSIRVSDIGDEQILIQGKGNKERYIFLDQHSKQLIRQQLSEHNSKWLFPSPVKGHITDKSMRVRIKDVAKEAGVKSRVAPHMFRHTFGIELMKNGCHIRYIQELLGHANISSTQIYTQVSNQGLKEAYKQYSVSLD